MIKAPNDAMLEVARQLTAAGLPSSWESTEHYRGTLTVAGTPIRVECNIRGQLVVNYTRYTNYRHGGYKLRQMVAQIIALLPTVIREKQLREARKSMQEMAEQLDQVHQEDDRLHVTWDQYRNRFEVHFSVEDFTLASIAIDRLREMDSYGVEFQVRAEPTPPRFRIENADGDPTGPELSLYQLIGLVMDITEDVVDQLAMCKLRYRVDLGDQLWYTRVK